MTKEQTTEKEFLINDTKWKIDYQTNKIKEYENGTLPTDEMNVEWHLKYHRKKLKIAKIHLGLFKTIK